MADHTTTGLPRSIEAAWGLGERPSRGPKPGLTLDRIVAAAITVADTKGLDALSMSRVAKELGSSAMSLYRYVTAKDELLTLMVDAGYGTPPEPVPADWRAGLTRWAWAEFKALISRPWLVQVPITGPPVTPNQLAWLESGLKSLSRTGLGAAEKMSAILLLTGYSRNAATLAIQIVAPPGAQIMPDYAAVIRKLIDPNTYPELTAVVDSGIFDADDDHSAEFDFGLDRVLDGIAALLPIKGEASQG